VSVSRWGPLVILIESNDREVDHGEEVKSEGEETVHQKESRSSPRQEEDDEVGGKEVDQEDSAEKDVEEARQEGGPEAQIFRRLASRGTAAYARVLSCSVMDPADRLRDGRRQLRRKRRPLSIVACFGPAA
jgi:hypothetical protein